MRRDTTQRVSMPVFGPCMVKYVGDLSESSHSSVEKLLDAESGVYKFPSLLKISRKMWREVQLFDITRLILTEIESNAASRQQWEHETHFFHPLEDALQEEEIPTTISQRHKYAQNLSRQRAKNWSCPQGRAGSVDADAEPA